MEKEKGAFQRLFQRLLKPYVIYDSSLIFDFTSEIVMSEKEVNPFQLFQDWYSEVLNLKELVEPTAVNLATADKNGVPSSRMVLLKAFDEKGFVFYTNLNSQKSQELSENPFASLCFHWMPLKKQIRIVGKVEPVSDSEADAYFATRPLKSKIGAWASKQSDVIEHPMEFEKRVIEYTAKFGVGEVPRPEFWSGYRVIPSSFEFWHDRAFRLHVRHRVTKTEDNRWVQEPLYP